MKTSLASFVGLQIIKSLSKFPILAGLTSQVGGAVFFAALKDMLKEGIFLGIHVTICHNKKNGSPVSRFAVVYWLLFCRKQNLDCAHFSDNNFMYPSCLKNLHMVALHYGESFDLVCSHVSGSALTHASKQ